MLSARYDPLVVLQTGRGSDLGLTKAAWRRFRPARSGAEILLRIVSEIARLMTYHIIAASFRPCIYR
jgi:hypothetical protein